MTSLCRKCGKRPAARWCDVGECEECHAPGAAPAAETPRDPDAAVCDVCGAAPCCLSSEGWIRCYAHIPPIVPRAPAAETPPPGFTLRVRPLEERHPQSADEIRALRQEAAESRAALAALRKRARALAGEWEREADTFHEMNAKGEFLVATFAREEECREKAAALRAALSGEGR